MEIIDLHVWVCGKCDISFVDSPMTCSNGSLNCESAEDRTKTMNCNNGTLRIRLDEKTLKKLLVECEKGTK